MHCIRVVVNLHTTSEVGRSDISICDLLLLVTTCDLLLQHLMTTPGSWQMSVCSTDKQQRVHDIAQMREFAYSNLVTGIYCALCGDTQLPVMFKPCLPKMLSNGFPRESAL